MQLAHKAVDICLTGRLGIGLGKELVVRRCRSVSGTTTNTPPTITRPSCQYRTVWAGAPQTLQEPVAKQALVCPRALF